jgi:DNA repair exonuclease SbcCD ATPase subunit
VISELSSQPSEEAPAADEKVVAHIAEAAAPVAPTIEEKPAPRPAGGGREEVDRLRERLAAAARPPLGEVEPQRTAAAVRDLVDGLRARLDMAVRERSELANALEEVRASLARAEADLRRERRMCAAVEAQAEERERIAGDAVAEAEALASERDQILADLAEQRRLESEQNALLLEAESVLGRRDAERSAAARDLAETRELLELGKADAADLEARLQAEIADRKRVEARCRELEAEVGRLTQATEALESIEAITRGR